MLKKKVTSLLVVLTLSLFTMFGFSKPLRSYLLSTASTGGTFYPVGVAFGTLSKVKLQAKHGVSLTAVSSAGSGENVKLMRDREADFGILQGLYGSYAWKGEGPFNRPQRFMRSITMLWQNVEHFVINSNLVRTGNISDLSRLRGYPFSIGKKNSGTEGSGKHILGSLGINYNGFNLVHKGYSASAQALQNGTIDGMNIPAGPPVSAITMAFARLGNKNIRVLEFTNKQLERVNQQYPIWTRYVIKKNTYPGQSRDIKTIAQPNFLAVHEGVPDEDVYQITRVAYENLPFLNGIHKATKAMSLDKAIVGLPVPLHPGAARYYRESGIVIPYKLLR